MATPFPPRLGPTDSVLWAIERDPALRSPILVVAVLDEEPDPSRVRASFEGAISAVPRLRQRIRRRRFQPGYSWEDDPYFSLDHHLRSARAPHPATMRTVLDMAQPILSQGFDRERALWEAHLISGVDGGRAALVLKIHHSATDGVGAVELASSLFDLSAEGDGETGGEASPLTGSWLHRLLDDGASFTRQSRHLAAATVRAVAEPVGFTRNAFRTASALQHLVAPISSPLSPVMRGRGLTRQLSVHEVPMDDLERAAHGAGGTVNDAYLAAVAWGLRRYHERHGTSVPSLRVTMPVNLRDANDPKGGNRFAPVRFEIPVDVDDPRERIRLLGRIAHRWRDEPAVALTEAIAAGIRVLPAPVAAMTLGAMFKAVDVGTVNLPGIPVPIWLAGAEVERLYAFAPTTGAALSVTLLSNVGTACIGIETDAVAVPDPDALSECMVEGFDQIADLSRGDL